MRRLWVAAATFNVLALASCSRHDETTDGDRNQSQPIVSASAVSDAVKASKPATPAVSTEAGKVFPNSLNAPSDLDMIMVFFDHVGTQPPIERWASGDFQVRTADEFKKDGLKREKAAALQSQFDHNKGVGTVQITSNAGLGEYSNEYHEFHISALAPGRSYVFENDGVRVSLLLTNAADFYRLPMEQARAEKLAEKYGGRSVRLEIGAQIENARPEGDGGTLEGRITKLRVIAADGTEIFSHS